MLKNRRQDIREIIFSPPIFRLSRLCMYNPSTFHIISPYQRYSITGYLLGRRLLGRIQSRFLLLNHRRKPPLIVVGVSL